MMIDRKCKKLSPAKAADEHGVYQPQENEQNDGGGQGRGIVFSRRQPLFTLYDRSKGYS